MVVLKYSEEELINAIQRTAIGGERHEHYNHTIKVADFAKKIMTGDDQGDLVVKYKTVESTKYKKQRIRVTNSKTQYVGNAVKAQYEELSRVDNVVEQYFYANNDDSQAQKDKVQEIEEALNVFYENDTLTKYLHESVLHLNFYDPNSFIVTEAKYRDEDVFRQEKPSPYPFEVYSDQAVNYEFENGVLGWLIARHEVEFEDTNGGKVRGGKYMLYAAGMNIFYQEIPKDAVYQIPDGWELQRFSLKDGETVTYLTRTFNTGINITPAVRVGYMKDPETNRETCVTPLWPAKHILLDLIWTKSEYDLCRALHGFYQKFIYAPECDHVDESGHKCNKGRCGNDTCPKCEGKGVLVHTTVQDVIVLKMPHNSSDMIPLENLVHYEHIPMDLIQQHKQDLKDLETEVMKAVFQRDLVNKAEVASTATEIRDVQNSKYNVISTYGKRWSTIWAHTVETVANYQDNEEGLIIEHDFSSDFIIETLSELFDQRTKAVNSNAPYSVIREIDRKIILKQNRDNADQIKKLDAKEAWKPLREKSESERSMLIGSMGQLHPLRIRYEYFEEILSEIYARPLDRQFHDLSWEGQKVIIDEIVNRIIEENRESVSQSNQFRNIFTENEV